MKESVFATFTLVGGEAVTLQIGHRGANLQVF
jgi:hypothetical protein